MRTMPHLRVPKSQSQVSSARFVMRLITVLFFRCNLAVCKVTFLGSSLVQAPFLVESTAAKHLFFAQCEELGFHVATRRRREGEQSLRRMTSPSPEAVRSKPHVAGRPANVLAIHSAYEVVDNSSTRPRPATRTTSAASSRQTRHQSRRQRRVSPSTSTPPSTVSHRLEMSAILQCRRVRRRRIRHPGGLHGVISPSSTPSFTRVNTEIRRQATCAHAAPQTAAPPITPRTRRSTDETGTTQVFYPDPETVDSASRSSRWRSTSGPAHHPDRRA